MNVKGWEKRCKFKVRLERKMCYFRNYFTWKDKQTPWDLGNQARKALVQCDRNL